MSDERAQWEASELAGLARQHGAKRVQVAPGVNAWQFPAWLCPHCTPIGGPDTLPLEGCPCPIARHGPVEDRPVRRDNPAERTGLDFWTAAKDEW